MSGCVLLQIQKMIPTYLINLDRSKDRLEIINAELKKLTIPYTRIPAVDGNNLKDTAPAHFEVGEATPIFKRELTIREIGCSMSHLKVYEKIVEAGHTYTLILEDDVCLPPNTKRIIHELIEWNQPQAWDIVLLHHCNPSFYKFRTQKINQRMRLVRFKRSASSTAAYIINLQTAKHLLKTGLPVRMPSDWLTGKLNLKQLKVCGILSSPFCIGDQPTTIGARPGE